MNKYFILLISLVFMFFTGCKKEQEEFSLVGKTYAAFFIADTDGDWYKVWRFISDTEIEEVTKENDPVSGGIIGEPEPGTYNLEYPRLFVNDKYLQYECDFIDETCFRTKFSGGGMTKILEFHQL